MSKKKMVNLGKLTLGMNKEGRIFVGEHDGKEGLDPDTTKDVTEDFSILFNILIRSKMKAIQEVLSKGNKAEIVKPNESEVKTLGKKSNRQ